MEKVRQEKVRAASLEKDRLIRANENYENRIKQEQDSKFIKLYQKYQRINKNDEIRTKELKTKANNQREKYMEQISKLEKQRKLLERKDKKTKSLITQKRAKKEKEASLILVS